MRIEIIIEKKKKLERETLATMMNTNKRRNIKSIMIDREATRRKRKTKKSKDNAQDKNQNIKSMPILMMSSKIPKTEEVKRKKKENTQDKGVNLREKRKNLRKKAEVSNERDTAVRKKCLKRTSTEKK